ncbi:MAG: hypothetical protein NTY95_00865 [Bacteroidia bacterium]|nr:hypothetical protein [Bacteroidia bacterium]
MRKKLIHLILSTFLTMVIINGYSQSNSTDTPKKELSYHEIKTGFNYAWYKNSVGKYGLNNFEFSFGYSYDRIILKNFHFGIQAIVGIKARKPYDYRFDLLGKKKSSDQIPEPLYAFTEVDKFDKVLDKNHYFFELPILVGYDVLPRIEILGGYAFRYYFPKAETNSDDFISNTKDCGIITGLSFKLSNKIKLGTSFYIGTGNVYSSYVIIGNNGDNTEYSSTLKSRYIQLFLHYNFR